MPSAAQHVASARRLEPLAARQHDDRELLGRSPSSSAADSGSSVSRQTCGEPVAADELDHRPRRLRRARADDLHAEAVALLERVAAAHERRGDDVAELLVVEEQAAQLVAVDGDVAHALA